MIRSGLPADHGFCSECGLVCVLTKDGMVYRHMRVAVSAGRKYSSGAARERCPGSGQPPKEM